jgi:hypothetical protein
MRSLINQIKKKKQFSQLPDSIIQRSLEISKRDVKKSRAILRKYFGVFLTNKILKPKDLGDWGAILKSHKSTAKRDYAKFYSKIFEEKDYFKSVIDLGCGVNGFSLFELYKYNKPEYIGVEASGQVVNLVKSFFDNYCRGYNFPKIIHTDLFDCENIKKIIKESKKPLAVFTFQIIDALEFFEKNFSKKFIMEILKVLNKEDICVLSFSTKSLSGKKKFYSERKWLLDFLKEKAEIIKDFEMFDERFIIFSNKHSKY